MSDPLPLSPETESGRRLLGQWTEPWDGYEPCPKCGSTDTLHGFGCRSQYVRATAVQVRRLPGYVEAERHVIAIEQEARTLARTQTLQEARTAVAALYPESALNWKDRVLAALSRLGERE